MVQDLGSITIICAGFTCQPFSQAGKRKGLNDPINGNHFEKIIEFFNQYQPRCNGRQNYFHANIHLIPRRKGDVEHPTGGIRNVISVKGGY